jgi:hypothetical protein
MAHQHFSAVSDEHGKKISDNGFSVELQKKEATKKEK